MIKKIFRRLFGSRDNAETESDVPADKDQVTTKATGGIPERTAGDDISTTGPGRNETFVGRAAGDDLGYAGMTGAERRAGIGEDPPSTPHQPQADEPDER